MDLYNGEIIAHQMARRPVFELVSSTLREALSRTTCTAELIVHSDQGWHYKMQPYRAMLAQRGVKQSMSRKGILCAWSGRFHLLRGTAAQF